MSTGHNFFIIKDLNLVIIIFKGIPIMSYDQLTV